MKFSTKIIFIFLFTLVTIWAQTSVENHSFQCTFKVPDFKYTSTTTGEYSIVNFINFTDPSKPNEYKLPSQTLIFAIPPNSNPSVRVVKKAERKLENIIPALNPTVVKKNDSTLVYEDSKEITGRMSTTIGKPIIELGKKFWFRDFYCIEVKINTHKFDIASHSIIEYDYITFELSFKDPLSFSSSSPIQLKSEFDQQLKTLFYNQDIAEQFRSKQPFNERTNSDLWINYSQDYVKVSVAKDALFKITKTDLQDLGVSTNSIDPRKIQLYEDGVEHPIFVTGEDDGSFDDSDYILFFGTKHYSKISPRVINSDEEPYNTYVDIYSDTSRYFLTWGINNGKRFKTQLTSPLGSFDKLEFHTKLIHKEINSWYQNLNNDEVANQTSNWNKNKTWYWGWIFENTRNLSIVLDNVYPAVSGKLFVKVVSAGSNISSNSHQTTLRFNNAKVDSQNINRFDQALLNGAINFSNIKEGNNTISIQNYANGTLPNWLTYDWFEIEYPKYNKLVNDSLIITIPEGFNNQIAEIQFTNASLLKYDIVKIMDNPKKINDYSSSGGILSFIDTVSTGDKYIICADNKISNPNLKLIGKFANIRTRNSQADYIALSPRIFSTKVDEYLAQIENLFNIKTKRIIVEDIYNEFGYGYSTPEAIKEYIEYAYENWSLPKPSYLVLFGDATYDYKGYMYNNVGVRLSRNYIPSYGNPVSDNWYTIWGDGPFIPQLKVGRIPILNQSDLDHYLTKVIANARSEYDSWNKNYLFFSGGNGNNPTQLKQLKAANDSVISNVIQPRPISGNTKHFYKTSSPVSDFGPFLPEVINEAIDQGSLFISYVGHSGTATWDNSINTVSQLKNNVNRQPVISDFGCSTNKYAEPDIVCFGEKFLLDSEGQALNYIGNSSLGFTSTAISAPKYFYESFLTDSLYEVGNAHLNAKIKLYQIFGNSQVFKVFSLSNVIVGDPIIRLKIPSKPNLTFNNNPLLIEASQISETTDSSLIGLVVENLGSAPATKYNILLNHFFQNELIESKSITETLPGVRDTSKVWIKTKSLAGEHRIEIELDNLNQIDELNENDNSYSENFNIYSSSLHDLMPYAAENGSIGELKILNPVLITNVQFNIITQLSESPDFSNPQILNNVSGSLISKISLPNLADSRYYLRYKIDNDSSEFSKSKSFSNINRNNFLIDDSISILSQNLKASDYSVSKLKVSIDTISVSVLSAGTFAGATCVIAKDGINLLSNSFFIGFGIVVFDPSSMKVDTSAWFRTWDSVPNAEALSELISSIPEGKIVFMGVSEDGQRRLIPALKNAIKTLGSSKIDQLKYQSSWAIIGRKGASLGDPDILEEIKGPYEGSIYLEREYVVPNETGYLTTTRLGPVSNWDSLYVDYSTPEGSSIKLTPIGINRDGSSDTLSTHPIFQKNILLSERLPNKYPYAKLKFELARNDQGESPIIREIGVSHQNAAELAINYQTASISKDTVIVTDSIGIDFKVSNVGEGVASNVRNKVDLYKNNMLIKTIYDSTFASINSESSQEVNFSYAPMLEDGLGNFKFVVELDADDNVVELYEDNNKYELPFVVKDTVTSISSAVVRANFDGYEIYDGDYVSHNPKIEILLNYEGRFEISDTNSIEIFLNQRRISFANLNMSHETQNNRIIFSFNPELEDGDYTISVLGDNIRPANSEKNTFVRFFKVSSESKILYPYNYPNPFANETHFTFKLTQIPDELKIKIFTIAGRLVREIKVNREELNFDFNRVPWDGRDEDGDLLANGAYLYKIISYDSDKTVSVTSKIAIVR